MRPSSDQFADLIAPYLGDGFRLAMVMLRDRDAAEDVVQEASLKAWRAFSRLRGGAGSMRPWFLAIVANECRMARRRRWWSVIRVPEVPAPTGLKAALDAADLRSAVASLPAEQQLPLLLFFYLDLPMPEVARVLGVSPAGARSRLYRAVARLRPLIDPQEVLP